MRTKKFLGELNAESGDKLVIEFSEDHDMWRVAILWGGLWYHSHALSPNRALTQLKNRLIYKGLIGKEQG